jgi:hypothetical protein
MMPRLAIYDDVRTAADVRARAFAVFERRRAAYEKLAAEMPPDEPEIPVLQEQSVLPERRPGNWRPIWAEVARQTGVPAEHIKKGDESRGMPITAYRQLAMSLLCRLTPLPLTSIANLFGLNDHSTVIHARRAMQPVLDATELTEADSVSEWVAAALPLLFCHLEDHRRKNRAHGATMHGANGKFAHICGRSKTANGRRSTHGRYRRPRTRAELR